MNYSCALGIVTTIGLSGCWRQLPHRPIENEGETIVYLWPRIAESPDPPESPEPPVLTLADDFGEGVISVEAGATLILDGAGLISGGVLPYQIYWIGPEGILSRDLILDWSPSQAGTFNLTLRVIDAQGQRVERTFIVVVVAKEEVPPPPPPARPKINLLVNNDEGPVEITAENTGVASIWLSWRSENAMTINASAHPNLTDWSGAVDVFGVKNLNLTPGVYSLALTAANSAAETVSDSVVVTVKSSVSPPAEPLALTGVTFSPPAAGRTYYLVGEKVLITVTHTGRGVIKRMMATSSEIGSFSSDPSGTTILEYVWPTITLGQNSQMSFFWPDDRDSPPDLISVPAIVRRN